MWFKPTISFWSTVPGVPADVAGTCAPGAWQASSWSSPHQRTVVAPTADVCLDTVFLQFPSTEKNLNLLPEYDEGQDLLLGRVHMRLLL